MMCIGRGVIFYKGGDYGERGEEEEEGRKEKKFNGRVGGKKVRKRQ